MIDQQMLWQLAEEACSGMLGLTIVDRGADGSSTDSSLGARVAITGEARALMTLVCDEAFARYLACTMFMMSDEELTEDEVHDAIGELVNIVGGNVKGIIPAETNLSLPCVGPANSFPEDDSYDETIVINGDSEGFCFTINLQMMQSQAVAV